MIRKHENAVSWKAGLLALAVHGVLFLAMIASINWKAAHPPMQVTEVELWDKLPAPKLVTPVVQAEPPKQDPTPEVKNEPKPEPKPVVVEKLKEEAPKVDIELEKKKQEKIEKEKIAQEKALEEKRKKEALEKLKQDAREEEVRDEKAEKAEKKKQQDALKKLQQESLSEESGKEEKQASAANASLIGEYTEKIKAKIRGNVNQSLCGEGNPELRFNISVLPTGDVSGNPKLVKSSGNSACDDAVERAIMASQPLPLPTEASAKAQFRNLNLKFRPND